MTTTEPKLGVVYQVRLLQGVTIYVPETSRVCCLCGCGTNTDSSAMGTFLRQGKIVDAHLTCADQNNLHAVDEWAESNE